MKRLFINYRASDAWNAAERLAADLNRALTPGQVFLDSRGIDGGEEWPDRLHAELAKANVFFALIGKQWLTARNDMSQQRRLDEPGDWVRREIEVSLIRQKQGGLTVVPVLVDGATLPDMVALPESLHRLLKLQARPLRNGPDWDRDVAALITLLIDHGCSLASTTDAHLGTVKNISSGSTVAGITEDELELLRAAAADPSGSIQIREFIGGYHISTNGRQFVEPGNPRSRARWDHALQQLCDRDLICPRGSQRALFSVTNDGYSMVDSAKNIPTVATNAIEERTNPRNAPADPLSPIPEPSLHPVSTAATGAQFERRLQPIAQQALRVGTRREGDDRIREQIEAEEACKELRWQRAQLIALNTGLCTAISCTILLPMSCLANGINEGAVILSVVGVAVACAFVVSLQRHRAQMVARLIDLRFLCLHRRP